MWMIVIIGKKEEGKSYHFSFLASYKITEKITIIFDIIILSIVYIGKLNVCTCAPSRWVTVNDQRHLLLSVFSGPKSTHGKKWMDRNFTSLLIFDQKMCTEKSFLFWPVTYILVTLIFSSFFSTPQMNVVAECP